VLCEISARVADGIKFAREIEIAGEIDEAAGD
jgi:hypothetical protein